MRASPSSMRFQRWSRPTVPATAAVEVSWTWVSRNRSASTPGWTQITGVRGDASRYMRAVNSDEVITASAARRAPERVQRALLARQLVVPPQVGQPLERRGGRRIDMCLGDVAEDQVGAVRADRPAQPSDDAGKPPRLARAAGAHDCGRHAELAHRGPVGPSSRNTHAGAMPSGRWRSIARSTWLDPPGAAVCETRSGLRRAPPVTSASCRAAQSPNGLTRRSLFALGA